MRSTQVAILSAQVFGLTVERSGQVLVLIMLSHVGFINFSSFLFLVSIHSLVQVLDQQTTIKANGFHPEVSAKLIFSPSS